MKRGKGKGCLIVVLVVVGLIVASNVADHNSRTPREREIAVGFNQLNGSHIELTKRIKSRMNDPSSYDHVETVYWDKGDYLLVKTTFRGTNAFGGVVQNVARARVGLGGQVLEMLD
jgi:hypothetical protein